MKKNLKELAVIIVACFVSIKAWDMYLKVSSITLDNQVVSISVGGKSYRVGPKWHLMTVGENGINTAVWLKLTEETNEH